MTTTNPGPAVMRIGGVEVPLVAMLEPPEIERVKPVASSAAPAAEPFTFTCEIRSATSARAFFDAIKMPQPRHKLTLTRKRRDGSTIVDVVEVDRIDVVIARRGLKRPGQWTDATRARRHKRLVRAAERRAGISRRGLVRGFPLHVGETASAAYWLAFDSPGGPLDGLRKEAARIYQPLVNEAAAKVAPGMPPPVLTFGPTVGSIGVVLPPALTFEGPDIATRDGLILGVDLAPTASEHAELLVWTHPAYLDLKTIAQMREEAQATEERARKNGIALHVIVQPEGFDAKAYRLAP